MAAAFPPSASRRDVSLPVAFDLPALPDIRRRLKAYKNANRAAVAAYRRIVRAEPRRALDLLLFKDMLSHEAEMRIAAPQVLQAKRFYDRQSVQVRRRIDERLGKTDPYYRDKALVAEVLLEMSRQNRETLSEHTP